MQRLIIVLATTLSFVGCSKPPEAIVENLPALSFEQTTIVPADGSLHRAEDGVVLNDGTILVSDQTHGLVALSPDGSVRPYGDFAAAGYQHKPPSQSAGPNGVAFEPDGRHVLVADVFTGAIYRVDTVNESTVMLYKHKFGVNAAQVDSSGAIWFTQSTENNGPDSETRMFAAIDMDKPDGALYRIAPVNEDAMVRKAELKVAELDFANGFVIDEKRGELYLAETMSNRVLGLKFDLETGAVTERRVVAGILSPDNIEQDETGQLWVASPFGNEILTINPDTGDVHSVFHSHTPESKRIIAEFKRRSAAGESLLALFSPDVWLPMPGLVTGIILTPDSGPIYISNLGNALVKLER